MSVSMTAEPVHEPEVAAVRDRADITRQIRLVVAFGVAALAMLYFWLGTDDGSFRYKLDQGFSAKVHEANAIPIFVVCAVIGVVAVVLAALNRVPKSWVGALISTLVGIAFFFSFLIWNYVDQGTSSAIVANPLPNAIKLATPLVLGALAGCLCERAGVINIAIEGQFLMGAFIAAVVASFAWDSDHRMSQGMSGILGLVGGALAGVLVAALLAWFAIKYVVNQVVLGVVITALASGLTKFLLGQIPAEKKALLNGPPILDSIEIPGLSKIPVVGQALFNQSLLVYLMYLSVVVVAFVLFQTKWGLRVRAVGEHPTAADTVGIRVNRIRWQAVMFGGIFAGLGGAFFTIGSTGTFDDDASAGNGFIALAAVIMGRWHPIGATLAAVFFGFMWSLQSQLSLVGRIPPEFLRALPYLATVVAVAGFVGRVRPPAADGEPYTKS
jgi:general nucleoside transport system permease protein